MIATMLDEQESESKQDRLEIKRWRCSKREYDELVKERDQLKADLQQSNNRIGELELMIRGMKVLEAV